MRRDANIEQPAQREGSSDKILIVIQHRIKIILALLLLALLTAVVLEQAIPLYAEPDRDNGIPLPRQTDRRGQTSLRGCVGAETSAHFLRQRGTAGLLLSLFTAGFTPPPLRNRA